MTNQEDLQTAPKEKKINQKAFMMTAELTIAEVANQMIARLLYSQRRKVSEFETPLSHNIKVFNLI